MSRVERQRASTVARTRAAESRNRTPASREWVERRVRRRGLPRRIERDASFVLLQVLPRCLDRVPVRGVLGARVLGPASRGDCGRSGDCMRSGTTRGRSASGTPPARACVRSRGERATRPSSNSIVRGIIVDVVVRARPVGVVLVRVVAGGDEREGGQGAAGGQGGSERGGWRDERRRSRSSRDDRHENTGSNRHPSSLRRRTTPSASS